LEGFPERLKRAMKTAGLSAKGLAQRMGVDPVTVSRWRNGKRQPDLNTLTELATVLGVSLSYLIEGEVPSTPPLWLRRLADLIYDGMEGEAALDLATRSSGEPRQTPAERRLMREASASLRQDLEAGSGGKWRQLSPDQKDEILARIVALAERDAPE